MRTYKKKKKTTKTGVKVELQHKTVTIKWASFHICMITFPTVIQAQKEFGKFRNEGV